MQLREMDEQVTYVSQLQQDSGPIVLINQALRDVGYALSTAAPSSRGSSSKPYFTGSSGRIGPR